MKTIQNISDKLERQLIRAFAALDAWFDTADTDKQAGQDILKSTLRYNRVFLTKAMRSRRPTTELMPEEFERELLATRCCDSTAGDISDVLSVEGRTESIAEGFVQGLRRELRNQLEDCLFQLDEIRREEEMNDRVTAVKCLLNLDIYQYIHCIIEITRRNAGKLK